jgi:hypothetical protein
MRGEDLKPFLNRLYLMRTFVSVLGLDAEDGKAIFQLFLFPLPP